MKRKLYKLITDNFIYLSFFFSSLHADVHYNHGYKSTDLSYIKHNKFYFLFYYYIFFFSSRIVTSNFFFSLTRATFALVCNLWKCFYFVHAHWVIATKIHLDTDGVYIFLFCCYIIHERRRAQRLCQLFYLKRIDNMLPCVVRTTLSIIFTIS